MIKKTTLMLLVLSSSIFAKEYLVKLQAFEKYEIKAQNSGVISFLNKKLEYSFIKNKEKLLNIDNSLEEIQLNKEKNSYSLQKEIIKIKEDNYKSKNKIRQLSKYEKNSEKLSLLEAKQNLLLMEEKINSLKNTLNKKEFLLENIYLDKIYINKGEYVNIGDKLFDLYDISKNKFELFLSKKELDKLKGSKIYIDNKLSEFKLFKVSKIKDSENISRYRSIFVNKKAKGFFFDKLVKVTIK